MYQNLNARVVAHSCQSAAAVRESRKVIKLKDSFVFVKVTVQLTRLCGASRLRLLFRPATSAGRYVTTAPKTMVTQDSSLPQEHRQSLETTVVYYCFLPLRRKQVLNNSTCY